MKKTDLRIGNLVSDGIVATILANSARVLSKDGKQAFIHYEALEPMPLTEEWLVKLGFENYGGAWFNDDLNLYLKKPYVESDTYFVKTTSLEKITAVTFVHQLQNLHFAITGQELTIKQ